MLQRRDDLAILVVPPQVRSASERLELFGAPSGHFAVPAGELGVKLYMAPEPREWIPQDIQDFHLVGDPAHMGPPVIVEKGCQIAEVGDVFLSSPSLEQGDIPVIVKR